LKQIQEVVGNTLEQIGIGNDFLNGIQKAQNLREGMNKWNYIKQKSFCTAKETSHQMPTEWEKIFVSYSSDKGLISKTQPPRINTPMKKWAHELSREFSKSEVQMSRTGL
jgi:hypothetical protein